MTRTWAQTILPGHDFKLHKAIESLSSELLENIFKSKIF